MYEIKTLSSAAFGATEQEQDAASVPVRADVALGGRPSCIAVSGDNLLVAAALGDKVGPVWRVPKFLLQHDGEAIAQ